MVAVTPTRSLDLPDSDIVNREVTVHSGRVIDEHKRGLLAAQLANIPAHLAQRVAAERRHASREHDRAIDLVPRRSGSDRFTRQPSGGSLVAGTHVQASHGRAQR
jgi:hypothetical protein